MGVSKRVGILVWMSSTECDVCSVTNFSSTLYLLLLLRASQRVFPSSIKLFVLRAVSECLLAEYGPKIFNTTFWLTWCRTLNITDCRSGMRGRLVDDQPQPRFVCPRGCSGVPACLPPSVRVRVRYDAEDLYALSLVRLPLPDTQAHHLVEGWLDVLHS